MTPSYREQATALAGSHNMSDEDCWYACPKSGVCCREFAGNECNCGYDERVERIASALQEQGERVEKVIVQWIADCNALREENEYLKRRETGQKGKIVALRQQLATCEARVWEDVLKGFPDYVLTMKSINIKDNNAHREFNAPWLTALINTAKAHASRQGKKE